MKVLLSVVLSLCVAGVLCRDAITVDPGQGGSLTDLGDTDLTRKYCTVAGVTDLAAGVVESNYAGSEFQCVARCSQRKDCLAFTYFSNKICTLLAERSTPKDSVEGKYFYRLKKDESCPAETSPYTPPENSYSNTYCMLWDYKCVGTGYYKKPQKMDTMEACLQKCSKIKSCGMVNYDPANKMCEPLTSTPCPDANLVEAEKFQNFLRLPLGETECADNRGPPSPVKPAPTPEPPTPEPTPEPTEEPETPEPENDDCGGKKYVRKVRNNGRTMTVVAECNAGCKMSVCHCKPYGRCDGARFTSDGKCRVDVRTDKKGKYPKKLKNRKIYAHIKCVPGSSLDVTYISTNTPGERLRCGDGYRLGDCTFFAYRRNKFTKTWKKGGKKRKGVGCGISSGKKGKGCFEVGRCFSTGVCYKNN